MEEDTAIGLDLIEGGTSQSRSDVLVLFFVFCCCNRILETWKFIKRSLLGSQFWSLENLFGWLHLISFW
jgi:hypothetical protein